MWKLNELIPICQCFTQIAGTKLHTVTLYSLIFQKAGYFPV